MSFSEQVHWNLHRRLPPDLDVRRDLLVPQQRLNAGRKTQTSLRMQSGKSNQQI